VIDTLPPAADRYFEDYPPGAMFDLGSVTVTEAEVLEFARRYDPQAIHINKAAAQAGPYGGLISSGWLTVSLFMRLLVDNFLPAKASLGSPGVDQLRWLKPVRPGDVLSAQLTVAEARRSKSRPDRGIVTTTAAVTNQAGEVVMTMTAATLMLARGAA
jgi:acyl dehydratase